MSPAGGSDGGDQPRVKRSRFDKPASSKGKAATTGPTATDGATVVTDKAAALERAKKALQLKDLQNSLQSKLAALKAKLPPPAAAAPAAPATAALKAAAPTLGVRAGPQANRHTLRLDEQGREVDEFGSVIRRATQAVSTLKVNQKKEEQKAAAQPAEPARPSNENFIDPFIGNREEKRLERRRRPGFDFIQQGRLQKQAEGQRLRAQYGSAAVKQRPGTALDDGLDPNSIPVDVNAIPLGARTAKAPCEPVPEVEWWDRALLPGAKGEQQYTTSMSEDGQEVPVFNTDAITWYVQHPVPIEPPAEEQPPVAMPLMLTKKEHRKLRKQRREEREKEKQELMRQGLLEPPKPKVKLSNMMRVLGGEAVADPTALEAQIRSQMLERQQAHEDRNEARKLTPAERKEKRMQKVTGETDDSAALLVAVYAVLDLSSTQHQWKVRVNAEELHMKGCAIITPQLAIVVAEGPAKAQKKYSKLMLQRIAWNAGRDEEEGAPERPPNKCWQAWSGVVAKPAFPNRFLVTSCKSEMAARLVLEEHGVGQYWDVCKASVQQE